MEYPKIETLYERDENFKVKVGKFKNRVYSFVNPWHWTEKIDGTNIRIAYELEKAAYRICGNAPQKIIPAHIEIKGRTDNAQIPVDLVGHLQELFPLSKFENTFQTPVILYGEGYGAGIQKGGGDYSPSKKFILFDVLVDNIWWLSYEKCKDVADKLGIDIVPDFGVMTMEEATEFVRLGFPSKINNGKKQAEGLVGRPLEPLFDKRRSRLITKLKTKDF